MDRIRRFTAAAALAVTISALAPMAVAATPTPVPPRTWRSDASIRVDVTKILANDRSLDDSPIRVRSVRRGVVVLGGEASSKGDLAHAVVRTARRPGVRRVLSDVVTFEAFPTPPAPIRVTLPIMTSPTPRYAFVDAGDAGIRQDVERAIDDLDSGENSDIRVRVQDGVVRLFGTVPSWDGNEARLEATRSVTGVRSILNGVRVVASSSNRR